MSKKDIVGIFIYILLLLVFLFLVFTPDKVLASGMFFILLLMAGTILFIVKFYRQDKRLLYLAILVLLIRLAVVFFAHYSNSPLFEGGGDFIVYDQQGHQIADMMRQNFSLRNFDMNYYIKSGIGLGHYYPVIVGFIYRFAAPDMFVGQLFNAWLSVICAILIYFLVLELGGSQKSGFWTGFLSTLYPSYLYYGSLLLKETLFITLCLFGLLLSLRLLKNFKWRFFCVFYLVLVCLVNLRFYVAYALIFSFIICWFLFAKTSKRNKIFLGLIITLLFGFIPQISGYGYMGINTIEQYINPKMINFYRQEAYNLSAQSQPNQSQQLFEKASDNAPPGSRSSISMGLNFHNPLQFTWTILKSIVYVILGPFPWQIKSLKQAYVLAETIPWYFLLYFIIKGAIKSVKKDKTAFSIILFSLIVFGVLSLFLGNFGIVTRIRMPAFISLLCLAPFGFNFNKINIWQDI